VVARSALALDRDLAHVPLETLTRAVKSLRISER
jgi:hypothetical protein